ncbi:MAG: 30S ribosomal protein S20 [Tannerellaceae bacterium]|nr:30S ribosomal protein S20 [Tannerellaceae bacterium]
MANHKSALKRIRQSDVKRLHNRYYAKTARNAVKSLRETEEKSEAQALYPKVCSMLDKLAKRNIIHKNKASNLKSKLAKHVSALTQVG